MPLNFCNDDCKKKNWEQKQVYTLTIYIIQKMLLKLRMVFCRVQLRSFFLQLACCYTSLHNNNNNTMTLS